MSLMHASNVEPSDPTVVEHSQLLSFGISAAVYLATVIAQLVIQYVGSRVRLPLLGNMEDPLDSYLCAILSRPVQCICFQNSITHAFGYFDLGKFF